MWLKVFIMTGVDDYFSVTSHDTKAMIPIKLRNSYEGANLFCLGGNSYDNKILKNKIEIEISNSNS